MEIDSGDGGEIIAMFPIDSRLCLVTTNAVYAVQHADQTDPDRTNPAIRNSMQKLLPIGARDDAVSKILLTAKGLCKSTYLGSAFDEGRAISLAWRQTKHVAALAKMAAEFERDQSGIMAEFDASKITATQITLPTMENVEQRFDAFAQKLGHSVDTLKEIARLFYPELPKKWIDALINLTRERYGPESDFAKYIGHVGKTLLFMRDLRNMVEHPNPGSQARVFDFRQTPTGEILVPSVEFNCSQYGEFPNALHGLLPLLTQGMILMTEMLLGYFCGSNAKAFGGFNISVNPLPPELIGKDNVKLVYSTLHNGRLTRVG
jgi:hypothetical protein